MRGRLGLAALVVIGALASAAPAGAASPLWRPPLKVSAVGQVGAPAVAVDPAGNAIASWVRSGLVEASEKSAASPGQGPGSAWATPVSLGNGTSAALGVDAAGDVTAVWNDPAAAKLMSATKPAGGAWEAPITVATRTRIDTKPRIAVAPSGEVVAAWMAGVGANSGGPAALETARRPAGGAWEEPVRLTTAGSFPNQFSQLQIGVDPSGDAVAAWARIPESGKSVAFFAASKLAGGAWGAPVEIAAPPAGGYIEQLHLAVSSSGDALAVFRSTGPVGEEPRVVEAAGKPAGGAWEAPVQISTSGKPSGRPEIAFDSEGVATAVWNYRPNGSTSVIQAATKAPGGSWGTPQNLTSATLGQYAEGPRPAIGPNGETIVAFERKNGPKAIETVARPAGGAWEAPVAISTPAAQVVDTEPAVGIDSEGNGVVAWLARTAEGTGQIEAARSTQTDEPPFILAAPTVSPNLFYVDTTQRTATISIEAGDDRPLTKVRAIVTAPGGGETEVPLAASGGNGFKGTFAVPVNTTTEPKVYPVEVIVEDSSGQRVSASAGTIRSEPKGVYEPKSLTVEPATLKFGPASVSGGETVIRTITLRNLNSPKGSPPVTGVLHVTDPQFSLPEGSGGELAFSIPARGEITIELGFRPTAVGQQSAELKISRTDGRQPALHVNLFGTGVS
jgi:hypothetical protein